MSARRGEVPFVAIRVGRGQDPREVLGLAAFLRVDPAMALGYVTLWEEFVLEVGDALTGRVDGYSVKHLAVKLGWRGSARRLSDGLRDAGLLHVKRETLIHPYWRQTITGQYARQRAEQREADRLRKRRARNRTGDPADAGADASGDVTRTSGGQRADSGGRPGESSGNPEINQAINGARSAPGGAPPPSPPGAGGSLGAARWDWIRANHRRPANSRACIKYLDALTDDDWDLCRWVVSLPARGLPGSSSRKKRVLALDSHKFLGTEAYLQFSPEWREKQAADLVPPRPKPAPDVEQVSDEDRRWTMAISFVLAQLADPDLTDGEKTDIRTKWRQRWPNRSPPWEQPAEVGPVQEVA